MGTGQRAATRPIDVLVVDDEPGMAELVGEKLQRVDEGFAVTTTRDPTRAVERVRTGTFDCVVSDYHMPRLDGLALLERVAEIAPSTGRVLYTTVDDPSVLVAARDTDVGFVRKAVGGEQYATMAQRIKERV